MHKSAIAKQVNDLAPRPQNFTELYFTDYRAIPKSLKVGAAQMLTFTVHNVEHKTTTYQYSLLATPDNDDTSQKLGTGTLTLDPDQTKIVSQNVTVPALADRINIKVNLEYQGLAFGATSPSLQTQAIHYWVRVAGLPPANKDTHERT